MVEKGIRRFPDLRLPELPVRLALADVDVSRAVLACGNVVRAKLALAVRPVDIGR
jgi:hypothetical protein